MKLVSLLQIGLWFGKKTENLRCHLGISFAPKTGFDYSMLNQFYGGNLDLIEYMIICKRERKA